MLSKPKKYNVRPSQKCPSCGMICTLWVPLPDLPNHLPSVEYECVGCGLKWPVLRSALENTDDED
jgi:hypothetical protein